MSTDTPDPEAAYQSLLTAVNAGIADDPGPFMLVGIHTGGGWVAKRLAADLAQKTGAAIELGFLSSAFHRDDYAHRGLPGDMKATKLPLSIDDAQIILIDDILFTGRTIRAALNELFDYGRPRSVSLAILIDRGGRQLPFEARYCGVVHHLAPDANFRLDQDDNGHFSLRID